MLVFTTGWDHEVDGEVFHLFIATTLDPLRVVCHLIRGLRQIQVQRIVGVNAGQGLLRILPRHLDEVFFVCHD